jgi:hypothetical protein
MYKRQSGFATLNICLLRQGFSRITKPPDRYSSISDH